MTYISASKCFSHDTFNRKEGEGRGGRKEKGGGVIMRIFREKNFMIFYLDYDFEILCSNLKQRDID